jgi:hypothetical protein
MAIPVAQGKAHGAADSRRGCFALAGAGVMAWLLGGPRPHPKWLWICVVALIAALPLSISRGLFFKYAGVAAATVIAGVLSGGKVKTFLVWILLGGVFLTGISFLPVVQVAQQAFSVRWEQATETEGGEEGVMGVLEHRVGANTIGSLSQAFEQPTLGHGIGLSSNIAAMRMAGKRKFLLAEAAWPATIAELGPLLGVLLLGLRVWLGFYLLHRAWLQAGRGNILPMTLGGFALVLVFIGNTSQPTSLAFLVLGAGLMLAACNPTRAEMAAKAKAAVTLRNNAAMRSNSLRPNAQPSLNVSSGRALP